MNILVVNGPNLNLLGIRKPEVYGYETLTDINEWLSNTDEGTNCNFKFYQSNHEGSIVDTLQNAKDWAQGIIINAAAYTHYSIAIRDAIEAINIPTVEVHLSDVENREDFRKISVISDVCIHKISGLHKYSYLEALKFLIHISKEIQNTKKD